MQLVSHNGATEGYFTLTFTTQTTSAIPYNASASDVENALNNLLGLNTSVSIPNDPNGNPLANTWSVEFLQTIGNEGVDLLTANVPTLIAGAAATADVIVSNIAEAGLKTNAKQSIRHNGTDGHVTLQYGNQVAFLDHKADPKTIEDTLERLSGFEVSASSSQEGDWTIWTAEFLGSGGTGDVHIDVQTEGNNLPTGPAQVVVTTMYDGVLGEVQEIYSNLESGTFTLTLVGKVQQIYSNVDSGTFRLSLDFGGQVHTTAEIQHDEPGYPYSDRVGEDRWRGQRARIGTGNERCPLENRVRWRTSSNRHSTDYEQFQFVDDHDNVGGKCGGPA